MTANEMLFAGLLGLNYAALICLYCELKVLKDKVKGVDKRWKEATDRLDVECGNAISVHGSKLRNMGRDLNGRLKKVEDMLKPMAPNPVPTGAALDSIFDAVRKGTINAAEAGKAMHQALNPTPNPYQHADLVERLQQLQKEFDRAGAKMVYEVTYR